MIEEWKYHPVTIRVFDHIKEAEKLTLDGLPLVIQDNIELTAMKNAEIKGFLRGLRSLYTVYDNLKEVNHD